MVSSAAPTSVEDLNVGQVAMTTELIDLPGLAVSTFDTLPAGVTANTKTERRTGDPRFRGLTSLRPGDGLRNP